MQQNQNEAHLNIGELKQMINSKDASSFMAKIGSTEKTDLIGEKTYLRIQKVI
jgi:hypothetical protein